VLLCLALVLLWAQMGGWLHGLSHTLADVRPTLAQTSFLHAEVSHPQGEATQGHADQVCQDCLVFAALAFAAPVMPAQLGDWAGLRHAHPHALSTQRHGPTPFWAYRTRAPPRG
jgi:hypothetical protein